MSSPCKKGLQSPWKASPSSRFKNSGYSKEAASAKGKGVQASSSAAQRAVSSMASENCDPNSSPSRSCKSKGSAKKTFEGQGRSSNLAKKRSVSGNHPSSSSSSSNAGVKSEPRKALFCKKRAEPSSVKCNQDSTDAASVEAISNVKCLNAEVGRQECLLEEKSNTLDLENQNTQEKISPDGSLKKGSAKEDDGVSQNTRNELLQEAISNISSKDGRVKKLVKVFESLMSVQNPQSEEDNQEAKQFNEEAKKTRQESKAPKWALPGMQGCIRFPNNDNNAEDGACVEEGIEATLRRSNSASGLESYADFKFTPPEGSCRHVENVSRSIDSSASSGCRRRRESFDSSGQVRHSREKYKTQLKPKVTTTKPFKLRTEQRGVAKKEEWNKKIHEILEEEQKQRTWIANGLPWTTDEPEIVPRPPVKESTKPLDVKLHTEIRAVDRAEFDHVVADKIRQMEEERLEQERLRKLAEEDEIKKMRREMVPKAQPMPYFDRPFIPQRSTKPPTVPQEPKFHNPPVLKRARSMSWSDF